MPCTVGLNLAIIWPTFRDLGLPLLFLIWWSPNSCGSTRTEGSARAISQSIAFPQQSEGRSRKAVASEYGFVVDSNADKSSKGHSKPMDEEQRTSKRGDSYCSAGDDTDTGSLHSLGLAMEDKKG